MEIKFRYGALGWIYEKFIEKPYIRFCKIFKENTKPKIKEILNR